MLGPGLVPRLLSMEEPPYTAATRRGDDAFEAAHPIRAAARPRARLPARELVRSTSAGPVQASVGAWSAGASSTELRGRTVPWQA